MKINPKSQNGAITLVVLTGMLFLTVFLISMYIQISNRTQSSAETTKEIAERYNNLDEANAIYDSYFADTDIIPIYTKEQLAKIGSGEQVVINGKVYTFSKNGYYTIQSDLDLGGIYNEDNSSWSGKQWKPLTDNFTGVLDGLGHTITGIYINNLQDKQGLFGTLNGTVKNLNILEGYIKGKNYVGAIAGLNKGTVEKCNSKVSVTGEFYEGGLFKGIVGKNEGILKDVERKYLAYEEAAKGENDILLENAIYTSGNKLAVIPKGFKVSEEVGEKEIDTGLVIKDINNNEFVWIPVKKPLITEDEIAQIREDDITIKRDIDAVKKLTTEQIWPMAVEICTKSEEITAINYKSIPYIFSGTDTLKTTVYDWRGTNYSEPSNLNTSMVWEEDIIVNGTTIAAGTSYLYDSQEMFTLYGVGTYSDTLYQESYNKMIESVSENGGFYVGRYEISLYTDSQDKTIKYAQSKKDSKQLANVTWYEMYKYERDYAVYNTDLGVTSEMIWGAQWDQMLTFVNGKDDGAESPAKFYVTTSGKRKSRNSSLKTGMNPADKVANIFDLEASRYEWTQEGVDYGLRASRGADCTFDGYASRKYGSTAPSVINNYRSSRCSLYIK